MSHDKDAHLAHLARVKDFREYLIARYGDDDKPIRYWSKHIRSDYEAQKN